MNSIVKSGIILALGCLIIQLSGCASSSLVNTWHDPSFHASPLEKVLVIAIRKDATKRRVWEDAFAGALAKHGVAATVSYSLFPDAPPDTDQVLGAVKTNNFDGVMVVRKLPTEMNKHYVQGYTTTDYYSPYWLSYSSYFSQTEHPGYLDTQKVAIRAIEVTTTGNNGRLIWSATSKTPDPDSVTYLDSVQESPIS